MYIYHYHFSLFADHLSLCQIYISDYSFNILVCQLPLGPTLLLSDTLAVCTFTVNLIFAVVAKLQVALNITFQYYIIAHSSKLLISLKFI